VVNDARWDVVKAAAIIGHAGSKVLRAKKRNRSPAKLQVAPRAGFEPATNRLTVSVDSVGDITQSQFVSLMQAISGWEEAQNSNAKATLRNGGDSFPV
jgi:hypothetical protein